MRCTLAVTDDDPATRPRFPEFPGAVEVGRTERAVVYVDSVTASRGWTVAQAVVDTIEDEIDGVAEYFGSLALPDLPINVVVAQLPGVERAYHHAPDSVDLYVDSRLVPATVPRYTRFLIASLLVDLFLVASGRAWSPSDSHGEALSRVLAATRYPRQIDGFATAAIWLDGDRRDLLSDRAAGQDDQAAVGVAVLFLNWLHYQLGFWWEDVIASAAETLAETYYRLAGEANDAFATFLSDIEAIFPAGSPSGLTTDNPFPRARGGAGGEVEVEAVDVVAIEDDDEVEVARRMPTPADEPGETWSGDDVYELKTPGLAADLTDTAERLASVEEDRETEGDLEIEEGGQSVEFADDLEEVEEWIEQEPEPPAPTKRGLSESTIRRALTGAGFPATRLHLVETATANGASERVIAVLQGLPGRRRFPDRAAVLAALEDDE
jgi:hypothetical protein